MNRSNEVLTYATAFAMVAGGVLLLALVVPVIGVRGVQKATALNLMADSHRMISLAKTYDVKAAVLALKELSSFRL